MAKNETTALQAKEKRTVPTPAEQTRPGPSFAPEVDIFETEKEIILLADIPGVEATDLDIDLNENILRLSGGMASPEGPDEVDLMREYRTGTYVREFTLSEVVDQAKIEANLKDGVLRLRLPKVERAKPRKIAIQTGDRKSVV